MTQNNFIYSKGKYKRASRSALAVFLVVAYTFGVTGIGDTFAYYNDVEMSEGNMFLAQSLDFLLSPDAFEGVQNFGATTTVSTEVVKEGTLNFQYTTQTDNISCDSDFLGDLTLVAKRSGSSVYEGALSGFSATTTDMATDWDFLFYLDPFSTVAHGAMCDLDIVFNGWQEEFPFYSEGYSDEEIFPISLIANAVVLNEILPNPEGADNQLGLQGEWVELYNNSIFPLDLTGWYVKDAANHTITLTTSTTWNSRVLIGPPSSNLEWIVLYMNGSVLNNDGDTVSLYTPSGILVDSYSYGNKVTDADSDSNHTGGGGNDNFAGSETSGQEGKSDARKPDGYGAWVDPVPTPGLTNALTDEQAKYMYALLLEQFLLIEQQQVAPTEEEPVVEENSATTTDAVVFEDVVIEGDTNATSTDEVATTTETSLVDAETSTTTDETSGVLTEEEEVLSETSVDVEEPITGSEEENEATTDTEEGILNEEVVLEDSTVVEVGEGESNEPEPSMETAPEEEPVEEPVTDSEPTPEEIPVIEPEPVVEQEPTPEPEPTE